MDIKDQLKQQFLRDWRKIAGKKIGELNEDQLNKLMLWADNTELASFLSSSTPNISRNRLLNLFKKNPQIEIDLIKSLSKHFSAWYKEAKEKEIFQKKDFIEQVIDLYQHRIENECITIEAEFIRLTLIPEYEKCLLAFKELRASNSEESEIDISNDNSKNRQPTNLTHILKLYYEKNCSSLNKQQIEKLAKDQKLSLTSLLKKWKMLINDEYKHKPKNQSAKEFKKSYEYLMSVFIHSNPTAYTNIKNRYEQLIENYPDLIA